MSYNAADKHTRVVILLPFGEGAQHPGCVAIQKTLEADKMMPQGLSDYVWDLLYSNAGMFGIKPREHRRVCILVDPTLEKGVAHTVGDTIHLSAGYFAQIFKAGGQPRLAAELSGVLVHELTHVWQLCGEGIPGGVIEGFADLVRLERGLAPPHWKPQAGPAWDAGYDTTARFFAWLGLKSNDRFFTAHLNASLAKKWKDGDGLMMPLFGRSVKDLWSDYVHSY